MSIQTDDDIITSVKAGNIGIQPFTSGLLYREGYPSSGLTSAGYDLTLSNIIKIYRPSLVVKFINHVSKYIKWITPIGISTADINNAVKPVEVKLTDDGYWIYPGEFFLANSSERLKLPRDMVGICQAKSTLARIALDVTVTPLEPEWEGYLTLEIKNNNAYPIKVYPHIGICQLQYNKLEGKIIVSYKDRSGKYQGQPNEPITARSSYLTR